MCCVVMWVGVGCVLVDVFGLALCGVWFGGLCVVLGWLVVFVCGGFVLGGCGGGWGFWFVGLGGLVAVVWLLVGFGGVCGWCVVGLVLLCVVGSSWLLGFGLALVRWVCVRVLGTFVGRGFSFWVV